MKRLFFCLLFFAFSTLFGYEQDVSSIREGDFIVYAFKHQLSLIVIKEKTGPVITVEELTAPQQEQKMNWQEWLDKQAPGHTSWTITKIDLASKKVLSLFDVDSNTWIQKLPAAQLLLTLLNLDLHKLLPEERKYIGPQPLPGEVDSRPLWLPKVVFNGKELHPPINVFRAYWPKDGSEISQKPFDLYFAAQGALLYLPYWIEMHGPISKIKIMAVDSGTNLSTKSCRQPAPSKTVDKLLK
jgi:hypothetical protein